MQKNDEDKALSLAYFYLKFRPRTCREVERYLERRAQKYRFSPDVIPEVLNALKEQNYLDDKKFVEMYVSDRLRFKPRSVFLLKKELEKLGVSRDLIAGYFELNSVENASTALQLLQKKWLSLSQFPQKKRFQKAMSYLKGKGFSYGDSLSAYRSIDNEGKNPFEE